ncbi:ABC transporter substrate-binding protein [Thermorudis peleae]|uniref:ABC transporter substrate-binding protein n=1 Tax=Thermorudis peleae TaxID=1382356 RepID=UPI00068DD80A|nr:extracellular solute-binding protein [Thermorudis peleae]
MAGDTTLQHAHGTPAVSGLTRRRFLLHGVWAGAALLTACAQGGSSPTTSPRATHETSGGASATAHPTSPATPSTPTASPTGVPALVTQPGSKVSVVYWDAFGGDRGKVVQEIVHRFNTSQSDVEVVYQYQGNYDETGQKLIQALAAKQTPDLVLLADNWWFRFYLTGALQPLNDFFAQAAIDTRDYVAPLLNEGTRQGRIYWVPFARSTPLFYYNRAAWQEAGLPDRGPRTWEEFRAWAPKLVKQSGATTSRFAFGHPAGAGTTAGNLSSTMSWNFQSIVWQWGGRYSDESLQIHIHEPPAVEAGRVYLLDGIQAGWAVASGNVDGDFITGRVAALVASTAQLAGYEKNANFPVGTAFLPEGPVGFGCCTGGAGLAILKDRPREVQQAAFRYVAFATSPEMTTFWSQSTGYMPVRTSAIEGAAMQQFYPQHPNFKTAVTQLPQARPPDPAREWIPNGFDLIGRGLEQVLTQREDPQAVFSAVAKQLEEAAKPVREQLKRIEG